jgi:serine/threonine protein kinase
MLGRYALYEKIASGGMASVHIGRLVGPVGFARTVAIKRMHPQFAEDPEFVSMFLDEARLAARIRHPNVVPTLDIVAMAGELFLVMDFVQGESLARLIRASIDRGERIPPAIAAAIMVGVLHGLHAAHEAKNERGDRLLVVHRDVSPHNVLVGTDGVARVLDFGVAKAVGRMQTTREGQLKGKLAYMAPEQVRGEVTCVTDVYAASVVLWEALTCQRMFHGDNEAQVLDQLLRGCDVAPSTLSPDVPPALDAVTRRGLRVDPAKRFPTAREMARALEGALPLATASTIGDWVEASAKETLDERSARIASIESDSAGHAPPTPPRVSATGEENRAPRRSAPSLPPRPPPIGRRSQPSVHPEPPPRPPRSQPELPIEAASPNATDDMLLTQLSSGSVSAPARSLPSGVRGRRRWLAAVGGGLLLAAGLGVVISWGSKHLSPPSASIPAARASEPTPSETSAATTATAATLASATPTEDPSPSGTTAVAVSPPTSATDVGPSRPPKRVAHAPTAPPAGPRAKSAYNPLEHL